MTTCTPASGVLLEADRHAPGATFWLKEHPSTPLDTYWRCDVPGRHLPAAVRVRWFGPQQSGDAAIFVTPNTRDELQAIEDAKRRGLRVLVEVDDDWLSLPPRFLALQRLDLTVGPEVVAAATRFERTRQELHRQAASAADAVIVSTPALAELYRPINPAVHVCPNSIDPADWPDELGDRAERETFTVGFAGSTSHADDIPLIRYALHWASGQHGLEVRFIGWHPRDRSPSWETTSVRTAADEIWRLRQHKGRIRQTKIDALLDAERGKVAEREALWDFPITVAPWTDDLGTYRENLAALDVGLCPISEQAPFSAGRSDLKVLELAAVGALPIVSDSPVYSEWKGLVPMAKTVWNFVELVQWAATHRDEVRQQARRLWRHVTATRTIDRTIGRWVEAVDGEASCGNGTRRDSEPEPAAFSPRPFSPHELARDSNH